MLHAFAATIIFLVKGMLAVVGGVLAVMSVMGLTLLIVAACVAVLLNSVGTR